MRHDAQQQFSGIMADFTAQRTQEIGICMALGAQRDMVVRLVLEGTLVRVGMGLVIGTILSGMAAMILKHAFADFGEGTATSFGLAIAVLPAVGAVTGLAPAVGAGSIDLMRTLRTE